MKTGIIFDFDGVLVDSLSSLKDVYLDVVENIKSTGENVDLDSDFNILNGSKIEEISQYIHEKYAKNIDSISILESYREKLYLQYSKFSIDSNWIEIFEKYKNKGFSLSIASSCDTEYIKLVLTKNSIYSLFDLIVGGDQVDKGKPDPEVFLKCKETLCLDNALVVDDSNNGVKAAILANLKVIKYDNISSTNIGRLIEKSLSFNMSYYGQVNSIELDIVSDMDQVFSVKENETWSKMSAYNGCTYFVIPSEIVNSNKLSVIRGTYKNFRIGVDIPILAVSGLIKNLEKQVLFGKRSSVNHQNRHLMDLVPSGTLSNVSALNQINEEWLEESSSNISIEWIDSISLIHDHSSNVLDLLFLSIGNNFSSKSLHSTEIDYFKWVDMVDIDLDCYTHSSNFMATLLERL